MNQEMILGLVRHALTLAGGYLVKKGYTDSIGLDTLIGGLFAVVGVVWSMLHKQNVEVKASIAAVVPSAPSTTTVNVEK